MKRNHLFKARFTIMLALIFTLSLITFSQKASSIDNYPDIEVTVSPSEIKAGINEDFTLTYHFEPKPIPVQKINPQTNKEIVLVIDTSGSMNEKINYYQTRLQALKIAANNFIDKFSEIDNVKLGIVAYSRQSNVKTNSYPDGMVSSKEKRALKAIINQITASGGTNIGDGLRTGISLFSDKKDTKKYLIIMSDGEPTALTYTGTGCAKKTDGGYINYEELMYRGGSEYWWNEYNAKNDTFWKFYTEKANWNPLDGYETVYINDKGNPKIKYGVYSGNEEPNGYALEYSKIMANKAKEIGIKNFVIGFSEGASEKKLKDINNAANGSYFGAKDANAIDAVYSQIADQIKADFTVEDIKIDFSLPKEISYAGNMDNMEINGTSFTQKIPDIKYVLNDEGTFYEAEPFDISIILKAAKNLSYDLPLKISYRDINSKIVSKDVSNVRIDISNIGTGFDVSRSILGNTTNTVNLNKEFQMEYRIKPKPIEDKTGAGLKPKEVVFVLDTSKSMAETINGVSKMDILKTTTKAAIEDLFKNNTNVKVSVVSYNEGSEVKYIDNFWSPQYLIDKSNKEFLVSIIDKIAAGEGNQGNGSNGEGSNTGDAIRKALWVLKYKGDANAEKHIILVGDGKTDRYTYIRSQGRDNLYKELKNDPDGMMDNNSSIKAKYAKDNNGNAYGEAYAQEMATIIGNNGIKSYFITLGKDGDDELFKTLSNNAKGAYKNCINANKEEFQQTMLGITDSLKPRYVIKNSRIIETLPQGIITTKGENKAEIILPDIVYDYKPGKNQYEAQEFTAVLGLKGSKIDTYDLNNDAVFKYVDLEQNNKDIYFNPLKITFIDEYILKQGLFTNKPTDFGTLGENYLINNNQGVDIAEDFVAKVGTYVRTSGQPTAVKIVINKDKNTGIKSINIDSIRLFKVTENNELEEVKGFNYVNGTVTDNYREITVNLPAGDTSKYSHYIINYNFTAANKEGKGGDINCSAVIEEVNRSSDFILKSVMLPDVF